VSDLFPYKIYTDGAARGRHNGHGPSSAGFVAYDREGKRLYAAAWALGHRTNNFAEYTALIYALNWALTELPLGRRYVDFKSDSEFMVRQINGIYRVNSPDILPLYTMAKTRLNKLLGYTIDHVKREFNKEADAMCNRVLDAEKEDETTFIEESYEKTDENRINADAPQENSFTHL
jgi:probable phosphoglycerate mutase